MADNHYRHYCHQTSKLTDLKFVAVGITKPDCSENISPNQRRQKSNYILISQLSCHTLSAIVFVFIFVPYSTTYQSTQAYF